MSNQINYAIYTRTACDDSEGTTNRLQYNECMDFVKDYGLQGNFIHYSDPRVSGNTINREGLRRLIADVRLGFITVIIITDPLRLSRRTTVLVKLIEFFACKNVKLYVCRESIPCPLKKI